MLGLSIPTLRDICDMSTERQLEMCAGCKRFRLDTPFSWILHMARLYDYTIHASSCKRQVTPNLSFELGKFSVIII